jgi:hypothetical protein
VLAKAYKKCPLSDSYAKASSRADFAVPQAIHEIILKRQSEPIFLGFSLRGIARTSRPLYCQCQD